MTSSTDTSTHKHTSTIDGTCYSDSTTNHSDTSQSALQQFTNYFTRGPGLDNRPAAPVQPYQVTIKDKMRYHSITMMKVRDEMMRIL